MKRLLRPAYQKFTKSRHVVRQSLLKNLRIIISIAIVAIMILLYPSGKSSSFDYVFIPIVFFVHLILSTVLVRPRFSNFSSLYLALILVGQAAVAMEMSLSSKKSDVNGIVFGLTIGLFYTLIFISKLPFYYIWPCSLVLSLHLILRVYISINAETPWLTFLVYGFLILFINLFFLQQELLDFNVWNDLQLRNQSLTHFQDLIQIFPNQIVILNKVSWEKDSALYLNREGEKLVKKLTYNGSIRKFLENFKLDSELEEKFEYEYEEGASIDVMCLKKFISGHYKGHNSNNEEEFKTFLASLKTNRVIDSFGGLAWGSKNSEDSVIEDLPNNETKFEIKVGNIEWNNETALILMFNDISKSDKIRELRQLHQNKDKLMATVSHELRTPLNGIIGMLDVVEHELQDESQKKCLLIAKNSAKTLLLMINDILDISQIQNGTLRLNIEPANLEDIIEQVLPLIEVQVKQKKNMLIYENLCHTETRVNVDRVRFQQILLNLLSNAIKFTSEGKITVRVEYESSGLDDPIIEEQFYQKKSSKRSIFQKSRKELNPKQREISLSKINSEEELLKKGEYDLIDQEAKAEYVVVSVSDTGKGIKPENINGLFKFFGKFDHKINPMGVGLGLAISQKLANMFGGSKGGIKVHSVFEKGTKFWFYVPMCEILRDELSPIRNEDKHSFLLKDFEELIRKKSNGSPNTLQGLRFLVVDDDPVNHIVLEKYIDGLKGCTSDKAYNGQQALQFLSDSVEKGFEYDLMLLDSNMPVMDGLQTMKIINEMKLSGKIYDLKVVALTGNAASHDHGVYLDYGMLEVWQKPLQRSDFNSGIMKHFLKYKIV